MSIENQLYSHVRFCVFHSLSLLRFLFLSLFLFLAHPFLSPSTTLSLSFSLLVPVLFFHPLTLL